MSIGRMMREEIIIVDYKWTGSIEDKIRLSSEYRLIEDKIKDTLDYLEELEREENRIYNEIMSNMEVNL